MGPAAFEGVVECDAMDAAVVAAYPDIPVFGRVFAALLYVVRWVCGCGDRCRGERRRRYDAVRCLARRRRVGWSDAGGRAKRSHRRAEVENGGYLIHIFPIARVHYSVHQ